jgi:hypothetical protein
METARPKRLFRKQRNPEMTKTTWAKAEQQFSAIQRQAKRALTEHEFALQERAEQIARLRELRLAKEAAGKERAETARAANAAVEDKETTS